MHEPLWAWAVNLYGREGVEAACLSLQDECGHNIPLLLWAAWAGAYGMAIDSERAVRLARDWSEAIVPLRMVRRRLKAPVGTDDEAGRLALRAQVKAAELQAERLLMAQLEALAAGGEGTPAEWGAAGLAEAVVRTGRVWKPDSAPEVFAQLIQALTKGEFLGYNG